MKRKHIYIIADGLQLYWCLEEKTTQDVAGKPEAYFTRCLNLYRVKFS